MASGLTGMAFTARMKAYFGLREGENIMGFAQELKALSYQEKCQFHEMLVKGGEDQGCLPPANPAPVVVGGPVEGLSTK